MLCTILQVLSGLRADLGGGKGLDKKLHLIYKLLLYFLFVVYIYRF